MFWTNLKPFTGSCYPLLFLFASYSTGLNCSIPQKDEHLDTQECIISQEPLI